ncbi:LRR and PYD domains-containing 12-like protein [Labeo rohita]|uniref:LRR and PYD domains-containing 12-like protein n=1 Tax=Labeo rohita TaxID=84645 RepID=A0A498L788_LABRO|nr:LRR and PYD domains-containing 12-like protein [Labeo rohita]
MKLAELAYRQLKEQCAIFREEDLKKYNISADEASQYPGVITCVSERKFGYNSRKILEGFLPPIRSSSSDDHRKVATYIKSLKRKGLSSERCIGLVRCLVELKNRSFLQEMHELERSQCKEPLTLFQCSLLAYQFVMSDTKHSEFDLRKYNINLDGFQRFSPAIMCFTKAL